jgi:hypothetical protein
VIGWFKGGKKKSEYEPVVRASLMQLEMNTTTWAQAVAQ